MLSASDDDILLIVTIRQLLNHNLFPEQQKMGILTGMALCVHWYHDPHRDSHLAERMGSAAHRRLYPVHHCSVDEERKEHSADFPDGRPLLAGIQSGEGRMVRRIERSAGHDLHCHRDDPE